MTLIIFQKKVIIEVIRSIARKKKERKFKGKEVEGKEKKGKSCDLKGKKKKKADVHEKQLSSKNY